MKIKNRANKLFKLLFLLVSLVVDSQCKLPSDITFCVADMKYDGKQVKICEFGDGALSAFVGYDLLYGPGALWKLFWNYLSQFNVPVWLVDPAAGDPDREAEKGAGALRDLHGSVVRNLKQLRKGIAGKSNSSQELLLRRKNYRALVFSMWRHNKRRVTFNDINQEFPSVICVGKNTWRDMSNKHKSNKLFNDAWMRKFRPACKVCTKNYTPDLAQSIINELNSDMFVIKPAHSTLSRGVIAVTKQDLDATLQLILQDSEQLKNASCDAVYKYWAKDRNDVFLVEAYAPSKIIHVQGRSYDATLRIAFCMYRMHGKTHVHILDGFWKFPPKSLEENGSLIDKHISNVYVGSGVRSAKVSAWDMRHIRQIMPALLKKVYNNILKKNKYRHHNNVNEHKRKLMRKE